MWDSRNSVRLNLEKYYLQIPPLVIINRLLKVSKMIYSIKLSRCPCLCSTRIYVGQFIGSNSDQILLCDRKPWLEGHMSLKFMKIKED